MNEPKKGTDRPKQAPNGGKGRPKGALNKSTKAVKDALVQAFDELGGVESLKLWAADNPTAFYQLWGKLLPLEVRGAGDNGEHLVAGGIKVTFVKPE